MSDPNRYGYSLKPFNNIEKIVLTLPTKWTELSESDKTLLRFSILEKMSVREIAFYFKKFGLRANTNAYRARKMKNNPNRTQFQDYEKSSKTLTELEAFFKEILQHKVNFKPDEDRIDFEDDDYHHTVGTHAPPRPITPVGHQSIDSLSCSNPYLINMAFSGPSRPNKSGVWPRGLNTKRVEC